MFQEQKLPDIGGTLIGMSPPKVNIGGGTRPPCPIGIDATAWKYGIMKDLHEAGLRGRLPCFIEGFLKIDSFQSV